MITESKPTRLDDFLTLIRGFTCNICKKRNHIARKQISREDASCKRCGSTVRMRSIIHLLSLELFGKSIPLPDFPTDKSISGIGMSDWDGYALPLAEKLDYKNTFYHQEPRLDITDIPDELVETLDFVISTDVFEHVLSPVSRAFVNTYRLLKPGGAFIFTVPFTLENEHTVEHFDSLHDFEIIEEDGGHILINTTPDGTSTRYENLVFHGGPGSTLEMRVFSRASVLRELELAGFRDIEIAGDASPRNGIFWDKPWSLPLVARK